MIRPTIFKWRTVSSIIHSLAICFLFSKKCLLELFNELYALRECRILLYSFLSAYLTFLNQFIFLIYIFLQSTLSKYHCLWLDIILLSFHFTEYQLYLLLNRMYLSTFENKTFGLQLSRIRLLLSWIELRQLLKCSIYKSNKNLILHTRISSQPRSHFRL